MASKDEETSQVIEKIAMDEPDGRCARVHEVIMEAEPSLKPRIWYGMPAYARSASTPALVTLRNDDRVNLALTEKVELRPAGGADGTLMPAAWFFDCIDETTDNRFVEIVHLAVS